jgi:biopolymer transport protein ExbB
MSTRTRFLVAVAAVVAVGAACAWAQAAGAPTPPPIREAQNKTMMDLIRSGGWAMWPLGACSVLTVGLTILNFQRVNLRRMVPPAIVAQVRAVAGAGDVQQLWALVNSRDCLFCRALSAGLRHFRADDPAGCRAKMEAAIAETAGQEEAQYGFYVNFLALLTSMSPMWGLLGTVSGMIGAFSKIGGGGMGKPEILAKNISEALVCTATGLLIAICAMGFYFLYRNILNNVMKQSEKYFTEVLDTLSGAGQAEPAAAADGAAGRHL